MKTKKTLVVMLVLSLLLSLMTVPAYAAGTGTIKLQAPDGETLANKTFSIYKIFNVVGSGEAATYTWDTALEGAYAEFFKADYDAHLADGETQSDETFTANMAVSYLSSMTEVEFIEFSKRLCIYVTDENNSIDAVDTKKGTADGKVDFTGLDFGYYLIYEVTPDADNATSMRSAVILTTANTTATPIIKVLNPKITKTVEKVSRTKGNAVSASVGETVSFEVITTVPNLVGFTDATDFTYRIVDEMDLGLTMETQSFIVYCDGAEIGQGIVSQGNSGYIIHYDKNTGTLTVDFKMDYLKSKTPGTTLSFKYNAVVNENVLVNVTEEGTTRIESTDNVATLIYSKDSLNPSDHAEQFDNAKVYSYALNVYKNDALGEPLTGAEFKLKNSNNQWAVINNMNTITAWTADENAASVLPALSGSISGFTVRGLGDGTYYLKEKTAPEGYRTPQNLLAFEVTNAIDEQGNLSSLHGGENEELIVAIGGDRETGIISVNVMNTKAGTLPETGGMGTTLFTIGGLLLMAAAGLLLALRKKSKA